MDKQTVRDIDVAGKRVFLRVDYNVQFAGDEILDDHRLKESLPTLQYLIERGAKVVACSHRGRPGGQVVEELRNAPVAAHLSKLLGQDVKSLTDCVGPEVEAAVAAMQPGEVVLLENVRFYAQEEANDPQFAKQLAALGDVFVSDAFGTAHRAHASVVGVGYYLPAVSGLLMERELNYLGRIATNGDRPLGLVLGGAKVADKIAILKNLVDRAAVVCVGGGIANTFLKAQGIDVGASLVENDRIEDALDIMRLAAMRDDLRLVMPTDVVIADAGGEHVATVSVHRIPPGFRILDLGRQTVEDFREALRPMKTVVWNGPVGFFEREPFDRGSLEVAKILADMVGATTVVGGGETAAAVSRAGVQDRISHVSTGGGASLEMLQGINLPGVEILRDRA
ncbi:MAG: phosphoglycerate kinase [Chloroflexi bacterium]|nr:phosphoglycerate kinase [Chloroflexota bacterium]MDA1240388.1 phosphoglycerate kinase [Chloroflexota bacterium]MQC47762.1 phosphoglycerate kinase [Chloroflexota bacterium]